MWVRKEREIVKKETKKRRDRDSGYMCKCERVRKKMQEKEKE